MSNRIVTDDNFVSQMQTANGWLEQIASKAEGKDGYTPERGKDYWTDADKTEIVNDTITALSSTPLAITAGGTGATDAETARNNIGALSNANGAVTREKLAADATESPVSFCSETAIDGLVQYRGKTLVLNAGSTADVVISLDGASTDYEAGFEIAILPYDVQSAAITFTSGKICAAGLANVLEASGTATVKVTLKKYAMIALKKLDSSLWLVTGQCAVTQ